VAAKNSEKDNKPIRLLLVDDEEELITYLEKRFRINGFEVTGVTSGPKALELAQTQVFDMAVVDLKMPLMDGVEVLKNLKKMQPFLQVLVLTGHGTFDTALESGRSKAYCYLEKPFDFIKLLAILREAYDLKIQQQREKYQEELERLLDRMGTSPQEILEEIRRLRQKYEQ